MRHGLAILAVAVVGLSFGLEPLPVAAQEAPAAAVADDKVPPAPAVTAKYPTPPHVELTGHTSDLWGALFSSDGKRAVTFSSDKTARIWDVATGATLLTWSGHD